MWSYVIAGIVVIVVYGILRGARLAWKDAKALPIIIDHIHFSITHIPLYIRMNRFYASKAFKGRKDVPYGRLLHQKLDVYYPETSNGIILVYTYGGAWHSGDKFTYCLMGRELAKMGYLVVAPNYRLYPRALCGDMLLDLDCAVDWTLKEAPRLPVAQPYRVVLLGHSAGGHLNSLLILRKATGLKYSNWPVSAIDRVINLSAPFDIDDHYLFEIGRGVEHLSGMHGAMGGKEKFHLHSPTKVADSAALASINDRTAMPIFIQLHGTADRTVPMSSSRKFTEALTRTGIRAMLQVMPEIDHTQPVMALFENKTWRYEAMAHYIKEALDYVPPPPTQNSPRVSPSRSHH